MLDITTYEFVKSIVLSENLKEGMDSLIKYCKDISPNPVWERIKELDYGRDRENLQRWLEIVLKIEPPEDEIKAFWFGIFNPIVNDKDTQDLCISGQTRYDPDDKTGDWASWNPAYSPNGRIANSKILQEIYKLVQENGVADVGEYVLSLGYAGLVIKSICNSLDQSLINGKFGRAVAVGFDSGDFIIIKEFVTK